MVAKIGRISPAAPPAAEPQRGAPAAAEPHPRLVRLAREVGAEIPLPPLPPRKARPAKEQERARYRVTIVRPGTANK